MWAVQLAKVERWSKVIFEGDAKICFDAINSLISLILGAFRPSSLILLPWRIVLFLVLLFGLIGTVMVLRTK